MTSITISLNVDVAFGMLSVSAMPFKNLIVIGKCIALFFKAGSRLERVSCKENVAISGYELT